MNGADFAAFAVDLGNVIFHGANWKMLGEFLHNLPKWGVLDYFGGIHGFLVYS